MHEVAAAQATPQSCVKLAPGAPGAAWMNQLVPFQASTRGDCVESLLVK